MARSLKVSMFHEEAALELIAFLAERKATTEQIMQNFNWTKSKAEAAQRIGIAKGCLGFYRDGMTVHWCWKDAADKHRAAVKAARQAVVRQQAKERSQKTPQPRKPLLLDDVPDMPIVRPIIKAGSVPSPATTAPRWVFDAELVIAEAA